MTSPSSTYNLGKQFCRKGKGDWKDPLPIMPTEADRPKKRVKLESGNVESMAAGERTDTTDALQSLYLESVNRTQLDFDQEKICSVTLGNLNVYSCLICGKFFAGRSRNTPAFFHSLEVNHHVFLNLLTLKAYILPDLFENTNPALDDIKYAVSPTYTRESVERLDTDTTDCYDIARTPYRPGLVGMNNLKGSDHLGVVLHALSHVTSIRDFFLLEDLSSRTDLVQSFGLLIRKLWSPKLLKAHISPHEFVRKVSAGTPTTVKASLPPKSSSTFSEPQDFMTQILNTFHLSLGGSRSRPDRQSIITSTFQGLLKVETQKVFAVTESSTNERLRFEADSHISTDETRFLFLTLNLPPTPLFQDEVQRNIIPQISLAELLAKYNGSQVQELPGQRRRYSILKLPKFLMFHVKRFTKSQFSTEKNPTIVNFPLKSLDMTPYLDTSASTTALANATLGDRECRLYDLLVNITHESILSSAGDESHVFRVQVRDKATDKWIQMEGLFVEEIKKDVISIGESVLQIWERRK